MAKKKKKRGRRPGGRSGDGRVTEGLRGRSPSPAAQGDRTKGATSAERQGGPTAGRSRPAGTGRVAQATRPSPWGSMFTRRTPVPGGVEQPPVAVSLARGVAAVGRSPVLLVIAFLASLGLWLAFSGYGVVLAASPAAMVLLESLPPLHSFLDVQFLLSGRVVAPVVAVAFGAGLVGLRSVLSALWIGLALESLEGETNWRTALGRAVRRGRRSLGALMALEAGFLLLALLSLFAASGFLGASLGQLGVIGALLGGLYFFTYAPIVAVAEGLGPRAAVRVGMRAARIPGPRHMLFTVAYLSLTLLVSVLTPGSRVAAATPTLQVWAYVLFVSFLHVGVLGAFTYRWLLLRAAVLVPDEGRAVGRTPVRAP